MGKRKLGLLAVLGCLVMAPVAAANDYKVEQPSTSGFNFVNGYLVDVDNQTRVPIVTDTMAQPLTVTCETGVRVLQDSQRSSDGDFGQDASRAELDPLRSSPACEQLRDSVLDQIYQQFSTPPISGCQLVNGRMNCYAVGTDQCDLMLTLYGNLIRLCVGGFLPYN